MSSVQRFFTCDLTGDECAIVIKNGEEKSGVTIHYVNEKYDDGEIILTKELVLDKNETVDSLESRIKDLESIAIIDTFKKLL